MVGMSIYHLLLNLIFLPMKKRQNNLLGGYTVSDELTILRQSDTKPGEFNEYFAFCEEYKLKAKELRYWAHNRATGRATNGIHRLVLVINPTKCQNRIPLQYGTIMTLLFLLRSYDFILISISNLIKFYE